MATRRRAVSRSSTRSSSSKPPKHKSDMNVHQDLPTTAPTQQEASSTITTTTTDQHKQPCSPSPTEKVLRNSCNNAEDHEEGHDCNNWSTPKAKRFRIPETESCPPAPKKQRASSTSDTTNIGGSTCSNLRRTSISFFTPPELAAEFFSFYRVSGVVPNMSTVD